MASVTDSESNEGKDGKKMGIEKGKAEVSPSDHLVSDVEVDPRSPVELANWLMYLSFAWAGPFLKLGSTQTLKKEDMYNIPKSYESRYLQERLQLCWESEVARVAGRNAGVDGQDGMMILRAAIKCFKPHLIVAALILIGHSAVHIFQAKAVGWLVGYFEDSDAEAWEGWLYAGLVVLSGFLFSCAHHHFFYYAWTLGMQFRVATTAISYNKILRLRLSSLGEVTTGYLVNLASSDVERFQYGGMFVHYLWLAPLETLVILYFGLREVGVSFLAGFAALALLIPLQACFSKRFMQVRKNVTSLTDERVKLTSQAITGARLMKINAWEPALEREISRVRSEEVHALLRAMTLRAINEAMFFAQPAVISLLVFLTYHYTGGVLESPKVFTTLALLNITQFTLGKFFYLAVQACSESWVSMQRLEKLLLMKENEVLSETTADGSKDQEEQTQGQLKMLGEDQKAVGGGGMGKEFVPSQHSISPSNDVSQSSGRIVMHQASFKWGHGDDDNGNAGLGSEVERSEGKGSDGSRRGLESELQVMGRDCGSGEKDDGDGNTKGTESVSGGAIAEEKIEDGVPGDDNVIGE